MTHLTEKQVQDYLNNDAERCPVCGARQITFVYPVEYAGGLECTQEMMCKSCNARWRDLYKLDWAVDSMQEKK